MVVVPSQLSHLTESKASVAKTKSKFNSKTYPYPVCRESHVWKPYDGVLDEKSKIAYRTQVCENCPTKRHSQLSLWPKSLGMLLKPSTYVYPDDYQVEGGLDKVQRGALRLQNFMSEIGN